MDKVCDCNAKVQWGSMEWPSTEHGMSYPEYQCTEISPSPCRICGMWPWYEEDGKPVLSLEK